jgi:hypothetical protein
MNPENRPSAEECLKHKWVLNNQNLSIAPTTASFTRTLENMRTFRVKLFIF